MSLDHDNNPANTGLTTHDVPQTINIKTPEKHPQRQDELDKKFNFEDRIEDEMVAMAKAFNFQLFDETGERKNLILYLKVLLPVFALAPLGVVVWMIKNGLISGNLESLSAVITAILAVPIEIIGVFKVISDKLFADTYRTSLPKLMGEYKKFNGTDKKAP